MFGLFIHYFDPIYMTLFKKCKNEIKIKYADLLSLI